MHKKLQTIFYLFILFVSEVSAVSAAVVCWHNTGSWALFFVCTFILLLITRVYKDREKRAQKELEAALIQIEILKEQNNNLRMQAIRTTLNAITERAINWLRTK